MQANTRAAHWIRLNHQCRIPKRWVSFDTESKSDRKGDTEIQSWRMGAAVRWRYGLKTGDQAESGIFDSPLDMWTWITSYCQKGMRTVAIAHNLGHDLRISEALTVLPSLGFSLEWCNLDSSVSAMTWRSDNGTLVLADSWTYLPLGLASIAPDVGLTKLPMPHDKAGHFKWEEYCLRDAVIVYRAMTELITFIGENDLGNWQPTGAGMAYATWRHRFMTHKVLVHDDTDALTAERAAMHTGRAEAWRHGRLSGDLWTELDMRNAYVTIASECSLPTKLKYRSGAITNAQYSKLSRIYRVACRVRVRTSVSCVPCNTGSKTYWPVGEFETWLWDTELQLLIDEQQEYEILDSYCYTSAPILKAWAEWILSLLAKDRDDISPVVKTWAKHCGRALIGRISLRCPQWEEYGLNPEGITGISRCTDLVTGITSRMMHVGNQTLIETERQEGRDSLPQVTGWIMAECRARLWRAMRAAGEGHLAHVDTDSVLTDRTGLTALRRAYGADFDRLWAVKGSWRKMIVYGPRNYRCGDLRKTSGVPKKADEILPNVFHGERWSGVASDLEAGRHNKVTVETATWEIKKTDPRRRDAPGVSTATLPYEVAGASSLAASSSPNEG
jgi:hypothetical protein